MAKATAASGGPNKAPAYQWYPGDAQTDEVWRRLTWEERGLFQGLLDFQWLNGSIPNDPVAMTELLTGNVGPGVPLTVERMTAAWVRMAVAFQDIGEGRVVNLRLERQRSGLTHYLAGKSKAGKASAEARRRKLGTAQPVHRSTEQPARTGPEQPPEHNFSVRGSVRGTESPKPSVNPAIIEHPPKSSSSSSSSVPSVQNTEGSSDLFTAEQNPGRTQVDALVLLWNTERQPGPKVMATLTDARRKSYGRALKAMPNLDDWRTVVRYLNTQPFANAPGTGDHATWRASLDWLTKPGKCADYLEKARLDRPAATAGQVVGRDVTRGRIGFQKGKYAQLGRGGT